MTTPALALFYGGMSRSKSVLNMMMMSFGALGIVGIVYVLWGWSMSYSSAAPATTSLGAVRQPVHAVRAQGRRLRQLRLRRLPADLRGHHRGPHQRRHRRPGEVLRLAGLRAAVGDAVLLPARPHGVGRRLPLRLNETACRPALRLRRRHRRGRPAGLRRRHRGAHQRRHGRPGAGAGHRQAPRLRQGADEAAQPAR